MKVGFSVRALKKLLSLFKLFVKSARACVVADEPDSFLVV
jgi:hypothetical protein